jgi:isoquinoline 1-oxidoreductase subunit alpha
MTTLNINGRSVAVSDSADTPLLWALRDTLGLTGTKYGCGIAQCGACTVHIDGQPQRSCQITVGDAAGGKITTIEGVSGKISAAVQKAWVDNNVAQCGYCQSGQIMATIALLGENKSPTDADIDGALQGNICRCATYTRIRSAVHAAAKALA